MQYLSAAVMAEKWHVSERSVRNYCAKGRVTGAVLAGRIWNIPENAEKPERINKRKEQPLTLLDVLQAQKTGADAPVVSITGHRLIEWEPHTRDFSHELGDQTSQRI